MEMDRPHTQKKKRINCKAGPNMEPTRQEKEGKTQSHLKKNHRAGDEYETADMATTGKVQVRIGWRGFINGLYSLENLKA